MSEVNHKVPKSSRVCVGQPHEIKGLQDNEHISDAGVIGLRQELEASNRANSKTQIAACYEEQINGHCPRFKVSENGIVPDLTLYAGLGGTVQINEHLNAMISTFGLNHDIATDFLFNSLFMSIDTADQTEQARRLNGAMALIKELRPQDPIEAMLASQMVATHRAAMSMMGRASKETTVKGTEVFAKNAHKLLSLYTQQVKAFDKHRGGGKQTVVVKHVHVHDGGQAIVGDVTPKAGHGEGV